MFSGDISKMAVLRSIIKQVNFNSKHKHNVLLVTDAHVQHNCRPYSGVTKGRWKVGLVLLYVWGLAYKDNLELKFDLVLVVF